MSETASQEPTMEEILASIRRIISEDETPGDEAAVAAAPPEDEIEEAEFVAEEAPAAAVGPEPEPETTPAPVAVAAEPQEEVLELTNKIEAGESIGDLDVYTPPAAAPAPVAAAPVAAAVSESLLSENNAAAVTSAFGRLAQSVAMPAPSTTLDGIVRELLRPLLKQWLDDNLRPIVEAKVEEEVERQARRFRG